MRNEHVIGLFMTEDAAIRIDFNSTEFVHLDPAQGEAQSIMIRLNPPIRIKILIMYDTTLHPGLDAIPTRSTSEL
jgi:hypothetical protein